MSGGSKLGRTLRAARSELDTTQGGMARALEVSLRTYQGWEKGDHTPRRDHRVWLRAFFDERYPAWSNRIRIALRDDT